MRRRLVRPVLALALVGPAAACGSAESTERPGSSASVLVYTRTLGYRHESIPAGIQAVRRIGAEVGLDVEATEDPGAFTTENLTRHRVVVFLSTTGDVLDEGGQAALQDFVRGGGGFVGVHAAADTEYDWPWYGELVGAWFESHPAIQTATVQLLDRTHASTAGLPDPWVRTDEWYNYRRDPSPFVTVLARLDESSYEGGNMGENHPIAWYREFEGGRTWYTGMGHTEESYGEPEFLRHLTGGIRWAAGM